MENNNLKLFKLLKRQGKRKEKDSSEYENIASDLKEEIR